MYNSSKNKAENFVSEDFELLHKKDLVKMFPYGRVKTMNFLKSGSIPLIWIGTDCIISKSEFKKWYKKNLGNEIYIPNTNIKTEE